MKLGGAERITLALAQHQRDRGLDAEILNLGSEEDFLVTIGREKGIPLTVSEVGSSRSSRLSRISNLFKRFEVVHIHSPHALQFIAPLLPLHNKIRFIYTRHGLGPLRAFYWRMLHWYARRFIYKATFVTQSACDAFNTQFNWPKRKTVVIENGVYIPVDSPRSPAYPLRFGSVGRMIALKGQKNLLQSSADLCAEHGAKSRELFELHFYGSGPLEEELRNRAAEITDAGIFFHGEVSDISSIYNNLDVLIVASETEGLSMVIIEAMAHGIPVIATRVGGNPTLVEHNKSGILVEYADIEGMRKAIDTFLQNPDLIQTYGKAGREYVSSTFSLEKTHQAYLAQYQE
jgi:glycosyltransferase involved in cell wall biosynthesis